MTADRNESPVTVTAVADHYPEPDSPDAIHAGGSSGVATGETRQPQARLRLVVDPEDGGVSYSMERLAKAFDRVRDIRDWQAPIRAEIAEEDRAVVEEAVVWFTATVLTFDSVP